MRIERFQAQGHAGRGRRLKTKVRMCRPTAVAPGHGRLKAKPAMGLMRAPWQDQRPNKPVQCARKRRRAESLGEEEAMS
jgi:hypothetical protein